VRWEVISETLTLSATDGTEQNILISITGTDDAPVVAGSFAGSVTEGDLGDIETATGSLSPSPLRPVMARRKTW